MKTAQHATSRFTCPMHPEVQRDAPGTCPECDIQLVPQHEQQSDGAKHHHDEMGGDHHEMVRQMRGKWLWTNFTIIALGAWLLMTSITFGFISELAARPQRELPSLPFRIAAMTWSDIVSGTLLVFFGTLSHA